MRALTPHRLRTAWIIAISVDALQLGLGLLPFTGGLSIWLDKPLDPLAMFLLWRLLGWHWLLLPTFIFEFMPFAELAPTWSAAMWLMTRGKTKTQLQ